MTTGRTLGLLLLATLLLLGYRLGVEPIGRTSEKRCHEVAGTMVETGNWLVPYYDGAPRLQKPPLYYWLVATAAKLTGGGSLLSTRLPSAIAAFLLLLVIYSWASALRGPQFGLLAAAMLWLAFQFATNGRRGDAEMWLTLASTAALASAERWIATRDAKWLNAFFLACCIGFLSKATVIFFTIGIPLAVYLWLERKTITVDRRALLIRFVGAIAIGALWYVALLSRLDHAASYLFGDLVRPIGIDVGPNVGDAAHFREPWYYLDKLPSVTFPICLLLPIVAWRLWKNRCLRAERPFGLVAIVFLTEFALFSLLPQKQKHYLLPLVPLFAILAAESLVAITAHRWFTRVVRVGSVVLVAAGIGFVAVLYVFTRHLDPEPGVAVAFLAVAVLGLVLGLNAAWRTDLRGMLVALILAELGLMSVFRGHLEPWSQQLDDLVDADPAEPATRDEILALAKEHPKLFELIGAKKEVEKLEESLAKSTPQPAPR